MRHAVKTKKLGRTAAHRKATLQSLSTALITHKRITTTLAKAKALRPFVEPILNRAKDDSTASRRQAFRKLQSKEAVKTLFGEIADVIGDRPGGYTRVIKLGQRGGDAAEMAIIELVDFNDVKPEGGSSAKRKTRRGRRSKSKAPAAAAPAPQAEETPAETPAVEEEASATEEAPETEAAADESASEETTSEEAMTAETPAEPEEVQEAEAVATDAPNLDATGNPQVPQTEAAADHPDAEQGAPAGTGEPNPEAQAENQGRSADHR